MPVDTKTANKWMAGKPIPGVLFSLNDAVGLNSGKSAGQFGAVISLVELEPEPIYLVETSVGKDINVAQSDLSTVDA